MCGWRLRRLAVHARSEPGREKISGVEKGAEYLLRKVRVIGAILDRFLHHAEMITITGKSYRLRGKAGKEPVKKREAKDEACEEPVA